MPKLSKKKSLKARLDDKLPDHIIAHDFNVVFGRGHNCNECGARFYRPLIKQNAVAYNASPKKSEFVQQLVAESILKEGGRVFRQNDDTDEWSSLLQQSSDGSVDWSTKGAKNVVKTIENALRNAFKKIQATAAKDIGPDDDEHIDQGEVRRNVEARKQIGVGSDNLHTDSIEEDVREQQSRRLKRRTCLGSTEAVDLALSPGEDAAELADGKGINNSDADELRGLAYTDSLYKRSRGIAAVGSSAQYKLNKLLEDYIDKHGSA